MAASNRERIGNALDLLRDGLVPFVERELEAVYGSEWREKVQESTHLEKDFLLQEGKIRWDTHLLLKVIWDNWRSVFGNTLGHFERSLVSELREVRKRWAHQEPITTDDAHRAMDSIHRLLTSVSAAKEAQEIDGMRHELLRIRFEEQARRQRQSVSVAPTEGQPSTGLKPWREIITPHPDVASGRYQQAEFMANLDQVYRGEGSSEYRDPREFFQRTYLTVGLRDLIEGAIRRLSGKDGDPVINLQTNFGGGKTHSMLALFHLFSDTNPNELMGIEEILRDVGVDGLPGVRRAVLVGTALAPAEICLKNNGTEVHTLWGELAWQLGDVEGYNMLEESDRNGVSPGSEILQALFSKFGPALILIDEWVAFVRMLYNKYDLPAGSFEANMTFAQSLTEAAKQAPNTLVVISVPASDIEIGGEGGREALSRIKNIVGRTERAWSPASTQESFEIVRRRLFQPIVDRQNFIDRDTVISAFAKFYQSQSQEFPAYVREGEYARRLESAYPIHPELFDRLSEDWSSLDRFQRTRGVLRLMASVIHELWERNDSNLLIMPATVPIDADRVQSELMHYLVEPWRAIIDTDIDGPQSLPLNLDRENPNLSRFSASRRVARTIFLGSAPTEEASQSGLDDRKIKLGCVQPGESAAIFGDALRRLTDRATHLYVDGHRYWYSLQPNVTRMADDRAAQQDIDNVWEELKKRIRVDRSRGDFAAVHSVPDSSADVPDEMELRLVILGPDYPHIRKDMESPAVNQAKDILINRGSSPRIYKNMLVFLSPDQRRLNDLEQSIRQYLAWDSIFRERESLNLDAFQSSQADTKRKHADETVTSQIREAYSWIVVPSQPDPQGLIIWEEIRLQGNSGIAVRASKKLESEELLIKQFSATRLQMALDKYSLWKDKNHLDLKKLWEYFATYIYLPRLLGKNVLLKAIKDGIRGLLWTEYFAYAEGWDEANDRYLGLKAGQECSVIMDGLSLLVKPEIAQAQLEKARMSVKNGKIDDKDKSDIPLTGISGEGEVKEKKPKRFHGTVKIDPMRITRDAGQVATEVIQHLAGLLNSQVEITLEIQANIPDGAPDNVIRTVTENCRTLRFTSYGFEEE